MQKCWENEPENRMTFRSVVEVMSMILVEMNEEVRLISLGSLNVLNESISGIIA